MAQQMRTSQRFAPLRVQRTFRQLDDGRGGRAAALAEALGVVMDATPQIAQIEGEKAFEAGMRSRIDGVKRENADSANKSMLGFMFSRQAKDGFDYQDAQLAIPVIQSQELLEMEEQLRESRNPEDLANYFAKRDVEIQERFAGKSDIYRWTVAESLQNTRQDQAKIFTSWVQNNREKDRRAAAAAAAKAKAQARALELTEAGNMAYDMAEGGNPKWFSEFVTTAVDKFGVTVAEAKAMGLEQAIAIADARNSPEILDDIDARFLQPEQRQTLADQRDRLFSELQTYNSAQAAAEAAEAAQAMAAAELAASTMETNLGIEVALGTKSVSQANAELFSDPYFRSNPDKRDAAMSRLGRVNTGTVDPAFEAQALSSFKDDVVRASLSGDQQALNDATTMALMSTRSKAVREEIGRIAANTEKFVRDRVFADLEPYYKNITQAFPSGVGQSELSLADRAMGGGNGSNYFEVTADTQVRAIFEDSLMQMTSEWYDNNPNAPRLPMSAHMDLKQRANQYAIEQGMLLFGQPDGGGGPTTDDAITRLDSLVK